MRRSTPEIDRPWIPSRQRVDIALSKARARAHRWKRMIESGQFASLTELAQLMDDAEYDVLACALLSVRAIKQVARRTAHLTAAEAQAQRLPQLIEALRSEDSQEGVRAFVEKRKPVWKGR